MVVLVDMDDTLECLGCSWAAWLNDRHGTSVNREDMSNWDLRLVFPELTSEKIYEPLMTDEFWDTVEPLPGAQEYLKRIIDDGDDVYIVTNTHYKTIKAKMEKVLFKYFPYLNRGQLIILEKKQMIKGDVLVDDYPWNLAGGDYAKILMDAPHNRDFNERAFGITRVKSWDEVYALIQELKETASSTCFKGVKSQRGVIRQ